MKKIVALLLAIGVSFLGLAAFASVPASASESKSVPICHDTGSGKYVLQSPDKNSIYKGGHGSSGINEGDIIPPFTYNDGGADKGSYPGNNWPGDTIGDQFIRNGCNPTIVSVNPPSLVPATCTNPQGSVTLDPNQPAGVSTDGVTTKLGGNPGATGDLAPNWIVQYHSTDPRFFTLDHAGSDAFHVKLNVVGPEDPLWNTEDNSCNMPDTGMNSGTTNAVMVTGGLILAAGAFLVMASRRKEKSS